MLSPRSKLALAATLVVTSVACHDIDIDFSGGGEDIRLYDDLYSVSLGDLDHAVAVGYYGAVYRTSDGGDNWLRGDSGTLTSIYSVSMADATYGWAVGQRGMILRTTDGGATWARQPNNKEAEGSHLFGVAARDKDTAWVVGEWGTRLRTHDGGQTWEDHSFLISETDPMFVWLPPVDQEKIRTGSGKVYDDVGLNDIFCMRAPSQNCWLIGEFGYIYYSEDGGDTWQESVIEGSAVMEPIKLSFNQIEIPKEAIRGLADFSVGVGGEAHLNVAIEATASSEEIERFGNSSDPSELFEILEARMGEVRMHLEDAGVSDDRVRLRGQPPWDYEDYLENDPQFLARYLEGRLSPVPGVKVRVIQNPVLFTVRFRDPQNGMIAGLGGVILLTSDGGRTWEYRKMDLKQAVFAATPLEGRAIAIGEKGFIRVSTDGGNQWAPPSEESFPRLFTYMRDVNFAPNSGVGLIVGQKGRILRTTDNGFSFKQVLPPPKAEGAKL